MISKLTPTTITQDCSGLLPDTSPCPAINTFSWWDLVLGTSTATPYVISVTGAKLLIYPRMSGKSIKIENPGMAGALSSMETAGAITVTLGYAGMATTSTLAQVAANIKATATVKDSLAVLVLGDGTKLCPTLGTTALPFKGTFANKNAIKFPQCPTCNNLEIVVRTWDHLTDPLLVGTIQDRHRRAVNFLGKKMKQAGQIIPFAEVSVNAEMSDPPDILSDFPPGDGSI